MANNLLIRFIEAIVKILEKVLYYVSFKQLGKTQAQLSEKERAIKTAKEVKMRDAERKKKSLSDIKREMKQGLKK